MQIIPEWGETSATVHHGGYGWQGCGPGPLHILAAQEEESREGRCTSAGAHLPVIICHAHLPCPSSAGAHLPVHICHAHLPCTSAMHICRCTSAIHIWLLLFSFLFCSKHQLLPLIFQGGSSPFVYPLCILTDRHRGLSPRSFKLSMKIIQNRKY